MPDKTLFIIDRKTASRLLKVSVRTIDRYIRRGKISAHSEKGKVWLDKSDVIGLQGGTQIIVPKRAIDNRHSGNDVTLYRDLYEEARKVLYEYQQKLEHAHYRIGQLESHNVQPILHKSFEQREDFISAELLRKELRDREKEIAVLQQLVKRERVNRLVFAILTYALLILLPILWYLLRS